MSAPEPFAIAVDARDVADLHRRLRDCRWPAGPDPTWATGADLPFLRRLVARWADGYDWPAHAAQLDALPNAHVALGGARVHVARVPGVGPAPLPLLLTHGAFSTFYEFHKVIGPLTDPARHGGDPGDAFDVVVWSLPGFAYSDPPAGGTGIPALADLAATLMTDVLGYDAFVAGGGSWGGLVASRLAYAHPDKVRALHLTQANPPARLTPADGAPQTPAEQAVAARVREHVRDHGGYQRLLSTRPDSLAFALSDSPVGLAAWFADQLRSWSDCDGQLGTGGYALDEVLTTLSITWFTRTAASSQRLYYELARGGTGIPADARIATPTGVLGLPRGLPNELAPPESIARTFDLQHYAMAARGGHHPALDVPDLLVDDLRTFLRPFR